MFRCYGLQWLGAVSEVEIEERKLVAAFPAKRDLLIIWVHGPLESRGEDLVVETRVNRLES